MEESAQILEVETFIPMLLQNAESGVSRIRRELRCVCTAGLDFFSWGVAPQV